MGMSSLVEDVVFALLSASYVAYGSVWEIPYPKELVQLYSRTPARLILWLFTFVVASRYSLKIGTVMALSIVFLHVDMLRKVTG